MGFSKFLTKIFGQSVDFVGRLPIKGQMPDFYDSDLWLNSDKLNKKSLEGQVVLIDFWTYSCINCLRTLPYVNAWHKAYSEHGLTIVGIHTPEFEFEKKEENVRLAINKLGIKYPVVLDNDYKFWHKYRNHYWPAHYFVDALGNLRAYHFGEGGYAHSENVIRQLLKEAGHEVDFSPVWSEVKADSVEEGNTTPETYLGYNRMEYLGSPEGIAMDRIRSYSVIEDPAINIFYLGGEWELNSEYAVPKKHGASITYRVFASQINLVMTSPESQISENGYRVLIKLDGQFLNEETKGFDCLVGNDYSLIIKEGRLYNLVNLKDKPNKHLIEVIFLDPGPNVYAFTFG